MYTRAEVALRDGGPRSGGRVWVTVDDGVYDVTEFVPHHPGGRHRIMQVAGGAVENMWAYWGQHVVGCCACSGVECGFVC